MNIMSRRPQVKARKVMNVLMKWAKKKLALEAPKIENTEESGDEAKKVEEMDPFEKMKYYSTKGNAMLF